jgi:hypothetical protein
MFQGLHLRVLAAFSLLGTVVLACSASAPPDSNSSNQDLSGAGDDDDNGSSKSGTSTSGGGSSSSGATAASNACSGKPAQACATCCGEQDTTFDAAEKAWDDCACAGPCSAQCGSWCGGDRQDDPTGECATCIGADTTANSCDPKFDSACKADANCKKVAECEAAAKCDAQDDAG